ncbi:MAG: DUF4446 family protein [Clostridia bacterium]|nr:DUF4446 family protein [Clostridia bacterium]
MLNFLRTDVFLVILFVLNIILLICSIISNIRIKNIKQNSKNFMTKLGNGKNLGEDLNNYMNKVINLEKELGDTNVFCKHLDKKINNCIQKVGVVRYNAYKDTTGDLSFAIALLNDDNDGIVLNGIYSREMSNIYAKPIQNGKSDYIMTQEEQDAVFKAMN